MHRVREGRRPLPGEQEGSSAGARAERRACLRRAAWPPTGARTSAPCAHSGKEGEIRKGGDQTGRTDPATSEADNDRVGGTLVASGACKHCKHRAARRSAAVELGRRADGCWAPPLAGGGAGGAARGGHAPPASRRQACRSRALAAQRLWKDSLATAQAETRRKAAMKASRMPMDAQAMPAV